MPFITFKPLNLLNCVHVCITDKATTSFIVSFVKHGHIRHSRRKTHMIFPSVIHSNEFAFYISFHSEQKYKRAKQRIYVISDCKKEIECKRFENLWTLRIKNFLPERAATESLLCWVWNNQMFEWLEIQIFKWFEKFIGAENRTVQISILFNKKKCKRLSQLNHSTCSYRFIRPSVQVEFDKSECGTW